MRELIAAVDMHVERAIETHPLTKHAATGASLGAEDLRAVVNALSAAASAYEKARERSGEALQRIAAPYAPLKGLQRTISGAIDERGAVLDRASPALARIRKSLVQAQSDARDHVASLLRSKKFARAIQDAVVTIREGRFVVPIKAECSGDVPGIVHDTSSSGQTLFVEPLAALEANNRARTLRIDEEREVARILAELSGRVGADHVQIDANIEVLARFDVLLAKARVAEAMQAVRPEMAGETLLAIEEGRHPLLGDRAVAQSLRLDESQRVLVISGPNMGGKTVTLKMAGLFVAMAYAGLQLPARAVTVGSFRHIFTGIGDEQSIVENASTFSAHLARMREILGSADARSLILVDEIGGGTEPASGAALAIAMLERLLATRACAIVTTHSTELKLFAHGTAGVVNASVRFDPQTFAPTYQLDIGAPGQSLAFPLARSQGIDSSVIDRAEELLTGRERDYERALAELSQMNASLQREREAAARERTHLAALEQNARSRGEALERERRKFAETAAARLQQTLREFASELAASRGSAPKVTRGQSDRLARTLDELHAQLGLATPSAETPVSTQPLAEGDNVRILSLAQDGQIIADNGDSLLVAVGPMRTVVPKSDVRRIGGAQALKKSAGTQARLEAAAATTPELDVRGKRYVEAEPLVDRWIDEAMLAGNSPLRLIHGKGTGMLGRGLQEFLRAHPHVTNVRYGNEDEGGGGVTLFELR